MPESSKNSANPQENRPEANEKVAGRPQAISKVRPMTKEMYKRAHEAKAEGKPTAYCFFTGCYEEILAAMDIAPIWTENFAGVTSAKRDAERFLLKAESEGYAKCLCTYATCGLGFDAMRHELGEMPPNASDGGMVVPDVMLGNGMMICDPRYKWYQAAQRYNDVPAYAHSLLWPPSNANLDEVEGYYIKHIVEELHGLVDFLEKHTGRRMDWERLSEIVDLAERTIRVWINAYELGKAVPTPMPAADQMTAMVPGFTMLGTQQAYDFYQELYDELKYRVDNKIGVVPEEKYRVLWAGGLPPWFAVSLILGYFESLGAVFPAQAPYGPMGTAGAGATGVLDSIPNGVTDPLERMAWRFYKCWTYWYKDAQKRSGVPEVEQLIRLIDDYTVDGALMHRVFSCRTTHVGQINILNVLKQYRDIPSIILESDIIDSRTYSETEVKSRIDAFIDQIDASKSRRKTAGA